MLSGLSREVLVDRPPIRGPRGDNALCLALFQFENALLLHLLS